MIKGWKTLTNIVSLYESFIGGQWGCLACFDYGLLSLIAALEGPPAFQENLLWHPGDFWNLTTKRNAALSDCNLIFCLYQVEWKLQIHRTTLVYITACRLDMLWSGSVREAFESRTSLKVAKIRRKKKKTGSFHRPWVLEVCLRGNKRILPVNFTPWLNWFWFGLKVLSKLLILRGKDKSNQNVFLLGLVAACLSLLLSLLFSYSSCLMYNFFFSFSLILVHFALFFYLFCPLKYISFVSLALVFFCIYSQKYIGKCFGFFSFLFFFIMHLCWLCF